VEQFTSDAGNAANAIETVLTRFKIPMPETSARKDEDEDDAVGGPYVEPESNDGFNNSLAALILFDIFERQRHLGEDAVGKVADCV
ncbi:hypothetical protein ACC754_40620, partial [Rhizobium johnstonii]